MCCATTHSIHLWFITGHWFQSVCLSHQYQPQCPWFWKQQSLLADPHSGIIHFIAAGIANIYIYIYVLILFSYVFTNSEFGLNVIAMNVYASILHSMCVIVLVMLGISSWCCSSLLEWQTAVLAEKSWICWSGNVWWGKHQFGNQWGLCSTCTCGIRFNGGIACTYMYIYIYSWFLTYLLTCTHMSPWSAPIV
jgi:hypothetical protein